MEEIIKEISELKTEIKYISKSMCKMEKVIETMAVLIEKQSVANNRILDLEKNDEKIEVRIRKLEDWQIKIITISVFFWTIWAFILNKLFTF